MEEEGQDAKHSSDISCTEPSMKTSLMTFNLALNNEYELIKAMMVVGEWKREFGEDGLLSSRYLRQ